MAEKVAYVQAFAPRFRLERAADGGERVVIPARRNLVRHGLHGGLVMWLDRGRDRGAVEPVRQVRAVHRDLVLRLGAWRAFVLASLVWMAVGKESLRVVRGDLEVGGRKSPVLRVGGSIAAPRCAISRPASSLPIRSTGETDLPLLWQPASGGVKFTYGARTVYAAAGLDEAEGRLIVDWLKPRLPKTAIARASRAPPPPASPAPGRRRRAARRRGRDRRSGAPPPPSRCRVAQAKWTSPTGFSALPPPGPATPVMLTAMSAREARRAPSRHLARRRLADRAVRRQRRRGDAEQFLLGFVGVGDETALDHVRRAGDLRQQRRDEPAGAGFGGRELQAVRPAEIEHGAGLGEKRVGEQAHHHRFNLNQISGTMALRKISVRPY